VLQAWAGAAERPARRAAAERTGSGGASGGSGTDRTGGAAGAADAGGRGGTTGAAGTGGAAGTTAGAAERPERLARPGPRAVPARPGRRERRRVRQRRRERLHRSISPRAFAYSEIDVGATYAYNEVDNNGAALGLTPLAISPVPGGGSRLAFLGKTDSMVHVVNLDVNDQVTGSFGLAGYDVQDIYADATGGVLLISRPAMGSTDNHNCGDINHLCGLVANYPTAASCYDMYMVRFNGNTEAWATKLTDTTRLAARLRHRRDERRQRRLHLVRVRAQRPHRLRRHELTPATSAPRSPCRDRPARDRARSPAA
jgi:hypothetical protein